MEQNTDEIINKMEEEFEDNDEYLSIMEYTYKLDDAHKRDTRLKLTERGKVINNLTDNVDKLKNDVNNLTNNVDKLKKDVNNMSEELHDTKQKLNKTQQKLDDEEIKTQEMRKMLRCFITLRQVQNSVFYQLWSNNKNQLIGIDFEKLANETALLKRKKLYKREGVQYALAVLHNKIKSEISLDLCKEYLWLNNKFHPNVNPFENGQEVILLELKKISIEHPEVCRIGNIPISTKLITETITIGKKILV